MEYTLKYPVTVGERTVTEIKTHRPKVKDFMAADKYEGDSVSADQALLSSLSGEPEIIIQNIDVEDWALLRVEIRKIWLEFFGIKPKAIEDSFPQAAPEMAAKNS